MDPKDGRLWQENVPLLYETFECHLLKNPSLSACFINGIEPINDYDCTITNAVGSLSTTGNNYVSLYQLNIAPIELTENKKYKTFLNGFGLKDSATLLKNIETKGGEPHKIRASYVTRSIIGVALSNGQILISNTSKPIEAKIDAVLCSHSSACWGLAWSKFEDQLVTSSDDGSICVWDLNNTEEYRIPFETRKVVTPIQKYTYGCETAIQTVETSTDHPKIFFSGDDGGNLLIWDTRIKTSTNVGFPIFNKSYNMSLNSISCNPFRPYLLATGGDIEHVCLWDTRMCTVPIAKLTQHQNIINCVEWNMHHEHLLASASHDGKALIWDISRIGREQSLDMAEEGPPELIFTHSGHFIPIQDVNWNNDPNLPYTLCSVCDGGMFTVWTPENILLQQTDEYEDI